MPPVPTGFLLSAVFSEAVDLSNPSFRRLSFVHDGGVTGGGKSGRKTGGIQET
jgi:hypothetical protein